MGRRPITVTATVDQALFYEWDTVYKPPHLILIPVLGSRLASCNGHHYRWGNRGWGRFRSLPVFPQPVIGKAGFRQDLPLGPMSLTTTHTAFYEARREQPWVHQDAHSGLCHHSSPCWSHFNLSQSGVKSYQLSDTHWKDPSPQIRQITCAHHKHWLSIPFPVSAETSGAADNDHPSAFCPFQG